MIPRWLCFLLAGISGTVTAANGVLYIATMNKLYAVQKGTRVSQF